MFVVYVFTNFLKKLATTNNYKKKVIKENCNSLIIKKKELTLT